MENILNVVRIFIQSTWSSAKHKRLVLCDHTCVLMVNSTRSTMLGLAFLFILFHQKWICGSYLKLIIMIMRHYLGLNLACHGSLLPRAQSFIECHNGKRCDHAIKISYGISWPS